MSKQILVNSSHYETRVATLEDGEIRSLHIEREEDRNVVGNIYKGLVKRVLPGMQAAFLELGLERTAFLYVDDIIDEPFGTDVDYMDDDGSDDGESESSDGLDDDFSDDDLDDDEDLDKDADLDKDLEDEPGETDVPAGDAPAAGAEKPAEKPEEPTAGPEGRDRDKIREARDESRGGGGGRDRELEAREPRDREPRREEPPRDREHRDRPRDDRPRDERPRDDRPREARDREPRRDDAPRDREPRRDEPPRDREPRRDEPRDKDRDRDRDRPREPRRDEPPRDREPRRDEPRDRHRGGGGGGRDRERTASGGEREARDREPRRDEPRDRDAGREPAREGGREGQREPGRGGRDREAKGGGGGGRERGGRDRGRGGGGGRRPQQQRGRRRFQNRRPRGTAKIEDLLKEGQEILVQVAKAPIGTKGARLTTHISLPGRNLVLMPTVKHLGISRRIESERERRRLRDIFTKRIRPKEVGFIIRTVAEDKSYRELRADADYLLKMWQQVKRDSKRKRAPALIHEDLSLSMRSVRDFFTDEVDSFVIDNPEEYEHVLAFIGKFMPRLKSRVKLFTGPSQLFEHYGIEAEISRALGKKVWLKSGGYLLIDQSEALTAIDVNTGRYVGTKSLEETILKTNLEAVKEVAYQLRIRNVGGIIIIDLIDMEQPENREKVFHALQDALGEDRAKTNILKISDLGLVEMTRKRTHEDLVRYLTEACGYCDGRGYHKSKRTVCFEIFREIEKESSAPTKNVVVFASPQVVSRMLKEEKEHVAKLEQRFGKQISIKADPAFHIEQYEVFGKG